MSTPKPNTKMSTADFYRFSKSCDDKKMAESKNKAIRLLEGMRQTAPAYRTQAKNPQEGSIKTMFSTMNCQWCNVVPSPSKRFSCPAGHTFCSFCGEERFVKHGAKCMIEIMDGQVDFGPRKNAALLIPMSRIITPYYMMNGFQTVHFPVCQQQITLQPEDPAYTAMWNRTEGMCPGGCNQVFKGRNLAKHLLHCEEQKNNSQLHKASENKPEEELPIPFSLLKSELAVNHKMVMPKQLIACNMNGCSMQMRVKDIAGHIMLDHHVYALDVGNDERFGKITGVMYIPQSEIIAKRPFYMLIRRCRRSFLFCMEHATDNSGEVGFWIRRISNMDNVEEDNGPFFKYNLLIMSGNMKVTYKNGCIPWRKSMNEIFNDKKGLKLPISLILDELVLTCVDGSCSNEKKETGYLLVNFEIMIGNAVGELYWDDAAEVITSSMESLTTAVDSTDQRNSDKIEVAQESANDNNDINDDAEKENEDEAVNVDDDVDDDEGKKDEEIAVNVDDDVDDDEGKKDEEIAVNVDDDIDDDAEKGNEEEAVKVADDVGDGEEKEDTKGEPQPLVVNAIEGKPNKMKALFERIYSKGEKFSPKYTP